MAKRGRKELEDRSEVKVPFRIYPQQKWIDALGETEVRRIGYLAVEKAYGEFKKQTKDSK